MKFKQLIWLLFFAFLGQEMLAQTANQFNSWWNYSGNHSISKKWSIHTLYSFRRNDFTKDWQQSLLRLGVNYRLSDKLTFTPGYDWVVTFPYGEQPIAQKTTEHRIYEQFMLKNKIGTLGIAHRYRLEQRFVNQTTLHRIRYRFGLNIPFSKKEAYPLFLSFFDEVFVNIGNQPVSHYFDQNWFYVGLGYKFNSNTALKLGYMNQYLIKTDNLRKENNHTLQLGITYDFHFFNEK